jgi:transcriptional regulator with XRE-family HTH domain
MLDQYMTENNISASELARRLGVTQPYASRLRRGVRRASPEMAERLEALTGIPREQFIFGAPAGK